MRATTFRNKLKRMQNHVYCLQSRAKQLQREQDLVQQQLDVLEGLVYSRDAWAGVIKSVLQANEEDWMLQWTQQNVDLELQQQLSEHPRDPERIKQQMLLLPALSHIDKRMHASVMQLTAAEAGRQYVSYLNDITQLLVLHELDPVLATPLLTAHCTHVLAWLLCLYYFNTHVAFELHHVNLLTRQDEAPPPGHCQNAYVTLDLTQEQQQRIAVGNQFALPRLKHLQQQKEALLQEMVALQQSMGPSGVEPLPDTPTYPAGACRSALMKGAAAVAAAAAATPGVAAAEDMPQAVAAAVAAASSSRTDAATAAHGVDNVGVCDSSNRLRQLRMAQANELVQNISANLHAWRVVASMRAHYSASLLTPLQMAKLMTAAAPYLLIGAPFYDAAVKSTPTDPLAKRKQ